MMTVDKVRKVEGVHDLMRSRVRFGDGSARQLSRVQFSSRCSRARTAHSSNMGGRTVVARIQVSDLLR